MVNQRAASTSTIDRVTAVHKIARLTDEIANGHEPRSLTDLSRALGFPKSTVADLCASLAELRMLQRTADGRYKLGVRFVEVVDDLLQERGLVQLFSAQVRGSTALSQRTVFLSTVQDDDDVIIEVLHGADPLPVTPYPGLRSTSGERPTHIPDVGSSAIDRRDDVTIIASPIIRGAGSAPPVWLTAMLPTDVPPAELREVSTALERLSTTLSIHGGAEPAQITEQV